MTIPQPVRGWGASCLLWKCALTDMPASLHTGGYPSNSGGYVGMLKLLGYTEATLRHHIAYSALPSSPLAEIRVTLFFFLATPQLLC